jgi:uncharacterized protein YbaP (TraB family)
MKIFAIFLFLLTFELSANSQPVKKQEKKYQGLLWEITGKGRTKPSYLFGTMHVSNKLAFHLADSFYAAIKSVDVVALETNPANWQDEYSKPDMLNASGVSGMEDLAAVMLDIPNDYMHQNTFAINNYENNIKLALAIEPAMINGMLYRTYQYTADFEEDTYLDMYIFQTGSKLGKNMAGVENFEESEKLVKEAYKDAAREKRNKINSDEEEDNIYAGNEKSPLTLEDAYRKGDLDLLDSMETRQFKSKAFLEKFLYKRNEIQANNIDSIIRSRSSLFVGVGSAHLPGKRGVIELLRAKGYTLRPVKMGERDSQQKDAIDKTRVPVSFNSINSDDGMYSVAIPGNKLYNFSKAGDIKTMQYADMGNGAYYVISRVKTNGLLLGENTEMITKKVDSMLYENIPGKILIKTPIVKNGYKGFDILNKTRRGDVQHQNIFITPFEILFFKMSGTGDYVRDGEEAAKFFNSIRIRENQHDVWQTYQPPTGGFSIKMPQQPSLQKDESANRIEYAAYDSKENNTYCLLNANLHNFAFIEEDSFDLAMMDLSFAGSEMIEKKLSSTPGKWQGYPALDCKYKNKDGSFIKARFLLKGPIYYAQVANYKAETQNVKQFFDSFSIKPFIYPDVKDREDTAMKFTVRSPIFADSKKQEEMMEMLKNLMGSRGEDEGDEGIPDFRVKTIGNDTTGEKIFVLYTHMPKHMNAKDSVNIFDLSENNLLGGSGKAQSYKYLKKDSGINNGVHYMYIEATDTGSSRVLLAKSFYRMGHGFAVISLTDTLTKRSSLLENFFATFKPADTLRDRPVEEKENKQFFKDFACRDSATYYKALKKFYSVKFDSSDANSFKRIIDTLSWKTRDYLEWKQKFINRLDELKDSSLVVYLKQVYMAAKDTADIQNAVLRTLLNIETKASFRAFKELIITEPPVVAASSGASYTETDYPDIVSATRGATKRMTGISGGSTGRWSKLYDSLELTKEIFPDILQLLNIDEYKNNITGLLTTMVDSNMVDPEIYEPYFAKFYMEARQELKKERAAETQAAIARAEKANKSEDENNSYHSDNDEYDNDLLHRAAILLLPYWNKNPGVPLFFEDMLKLKNERIRFNCAMLLLRNNKPIADSLLNAFAAKDEFRIYLYRRLMELKRMEKFPVKYNNQADLIKSALTVHIDNKKDTLAFLDKLTVNYQHRNGVVYFFKYKAKKDKKWKIRSMGLQPENAREYDDENDDFTSAGTSYDYGSEEDEYKLDESKPVKEQLLKLLKKMLFKKHPSAEQFYSERNYKLGGYGEGY